MKYYLAVDIGASSGRHILSHLENGKMIIEEVHRFKNGMTKKDGHLIWDVDYLFGEILKGMKKCKDLGKIPVSMGIDTWGVDFMLLDKNNRPIGDMIAYRDARTANIDKVVYDIIPEEELYLRTGIQKQPFNTIYQLMALKEQNPEILEQAYCMLLVPDFFHFLLTGKKVSEYTNSTTTQLLNPIRKDWDYQMIDRLGLPRRIFTEIHAPGTDLGGLREKVSEYVGFDCHVVLPATHDTGSAVLAVPSVHRVPGGEERYALTEDYLYISSGTWSLMGTELDTADCTRESMRRNLTNEGGYHYKFRYLKNIMGMWMINCAKEELDPDLSYETVCKLAAAETIPSLVDADDERFMAPESMTKAVQDFCRETNQPVPEGIAQVAAVIYNSLAECYAKTAEEISQMTGKTYDCIHIVGGGANASYLNDLTAKACKKVVYAGPTEATAIGNIAAQMIASGELIGRQEAKACIYKSFPIEVFKP